MEFGLLGPFEVRDGERGVVLGSAQQRVVLGALLLNANRPVSLDRLLRCFGGSDLPARLRQW
jgi:DNA-binding SARP family transcriptional activator